MHFNCPEKMKQLQILEGSILNELTVNHSEINVAKTITKTLAFNAAKIWIDLSRVPHRLHDAITDTILKCTNEWFESENSKDAIFYSHDTGKFGFALDNINIWFTQEMPDGDCIDESHDESRFAMQSLELKKWLEMNALGRPHIKVLPLNAEMTMYGLSCKWNNENKFYQKHCVSAIKVQVNRWWKLFLDSDNQFKMTAPEMIATQDRFDREVTEVNLVCAFDKTVTQSSIADEFDAANVTMVTFKELGLKE